MSYDYSYLELNAIQRVSNLSPNNSISIPILSSPNRNKHSNYFSHSITTKTDVCLGMILIYFIKYDNMPFCLNMNINHYIPIQSTQNANDWDYPIDETLSSSHSQSNKSQNPSPRNDIDDPNTMTFDDDYNDDAQKNDDNHPRNIMNRDKYKDKKYRDRPISPLSAEANLSSEETSASTSSGPIRVSHENGTRNSMEDEIV